MVRIIINQGSTQFSLVLVLAVTTQKHLEICLSDTNCQVTGLNHQLIKSQLSCLCDVCWLLSVLEERKKERKGTKDVHALKLNRLFQHWLKTLRSTGVWSTFCALSKKSNCLLKLHFTFPSKSPASALKHFGQTPKKKNLDLTLNSEDYFTTFFQQQN